MSQQSTTTIEAKRQSDALERATGEWFCQSAHHYVKGEKRRWRNRLICTACIARMKRLNNKGVNP